MKKVLTLTALAIFGLAPAISSACEYDGSSAAAKTPEFLASAPAPEASKVPPAAVKKAPVQKDTAKQVADKNKQQTHEAKVVAVSTN